MYHHFTKTKLHEVSATLSKVAIGVIPAETVIRGATLVNVCTCELLENTDVAVWGGRIALVGDASHCIGEGTEVVDAAGKFIAPGFLDGHIHVESSMMSAGEYARAVVPHGTTGIYMDPHEICNVLGLDGVKWIMEDAARSPLKAMLTVPSCVPAVPGFEDTGAEVGPADIRETMQWDNVVGLGEMMNFPGIVNGDARTHAIVGETLAANKVATGHYSIPETAQGLNAYIASGVRCCHESTRAEDALAKMRLGMYAMLREGSAWHDLVEVIRSVTEHEVDSRFAVLISDDAHPHTLAGQGHLDHIMRKALSYGLDPIRAIQMVTINCAQCFRMDHELGSVTPGKCADLVLLDNLEEMKVAKVWINGDLVAENGKLTEELAPYTYPERAVHTMHIAGEVTPETFVIRTEKAETKVHTMEVMGGKVNNFMHVREMTAVDGKLCADPSRDILKAVVFERHNETGKVGYGFVEGFGIKNGAMASTVAHDAHNLLVVGTNDEDMAVVANALIECGGGMAVARDGKLLALLPLPIAGLMSDRPVEEMTEAVAAMEAAWAEIGCTMPSPFMTMALIPLACLPELRLTDRGLVDCTTFRFLPLEAE
ncbi:MAG: adenine deaminase [Clostridia bacterium]|nr:adenine deaminase [Clostridia bacterium]